MRKPINYVLGEAVEGLWKQELLIWLGKIFDIQRFFETGTCEASTLVGVADNFLSCYSIELSQHYYDIACRRIRNYDNIILRHGNSATELRSVLAQQNYLNKDNIYRRHLFWLDAHPSNELTANEGDPLPEEIRAIVELSPNSLVVIDDHNNADEVKNKAIEAGIDLTGWTVNYQYGITFMYKDGLYSIPEFE